MHTWLRITLLAICTAMGIAVALAVALNKPSQRAEAVGSRSRLSPSRSGYSLPQSTPDSTIARTSTPPPAPPPEPVPVVASYRDPVARQVGQLEDSILQLEESSQRR